MYPAPSMFDFYSPVRREEFQCLIRRVINKSKMIRECVP